MNKSRYAYAGDTAQVSVAVVLFPCVDPRIQNRILDHNTEEFEECGGYFAAMVNKGLEELENWDQLPKYNTVEELFEQLDN